jgi:glycosyltransferase involved in cell wall biosynthesis
MKYTFLLPAYKGRFLDEMLRSIQGQTYRDFKVIISDDCSPEDLRSICEPYLADPRFTYRRNAENMGSKSLVSHWNMLVDMCDTEFLILASDDDVYEPQFLEEIDKLTVKYPKVDLFRARVNNINHLGEILRTEGQSDELLNHESFILRLYDTDFIGGEPTYCYRTKVLHEKGLFVDFPLAWFSDDATNIMMSVGGCAITQNPLFNSRSSNIQITNQWGKSEDSIKKVAATLAFYKWMNEFITHFKGNKSKEEIVRRYQRKVHSNIQNYIYHCPLTDFLKSTYHCPTDIGLSKVRMCLHYMNVIRQKYKKPND